MCAVSPHRHTLSCLFPSVVLGSILPTLRQFQGFCHGYWDTGSAGRCCERRDSEIRAWCTEVWILTSPYADELSMKREYQLRNFHQQIGLWQVFAGGISLINDRWGRAQTTVGGPAPEQFVLGCIKSQAKRVRESKAASSTPPWLLLQLLPPGSSCEFLP